MEASDPSCLVIPNEVLQLLNPLRSWRAQLGPQADLDTGEWSNVSGLTCSFLPSAQSPFCLKIL